MEVKLERSGGDDVVMEMVGVTVEEAGDADDSVKPVVFSGSFVQLKYLRYIHHSDI